MIHNLATLLDQDKAITSRKRDLNKRREAVRAAKEKVFEAAGPADDAAFAKIGELGGQENLLTIGIEKCDRERAGLAASVLNEADHLRLAVAKIGVTRRDKILTKLDAALTPFLPDAAARARAVAQVRRATPEIHLLERVAITPLDYCYFSPRDGDEFVFGKQILGMAERAIAECNL
jgi:hypothetical protein